MKLMYYEALTFVCATPPSKGQILGISHEILKVVGFMRALQTSNGESKIKYLFQELKTSPHKRHKPPKPNNKILQTLHKKQTHHNILNNTIMLF